jgi:hypothetical protein
LAYSVEKLLITLRTWDNPCHRRRLRVFFGEESSASGVSVLGYVKLLWFLLWTMSLRFIWYSINLLAITLPKESLTRPMRRVFLGISLYIRQYYEAINDHL